MKKIQQFEPQLGEEEKKELMEVIDSGWFTEAKKTTEFEKSFANFVGRKYAVATTSGTIALFIAIKALDVKYNDKVIVPDLTFVASPNSVELAGGAVTLVDINKNDLCLDVNKTKNSIQKNTKGIMAVDFNGRATDLLTIKEFAEKNDLFVIEDACHTIGSYYNGKHMGFYSDVGIFSLATPKIITTGQGGLLVTDNDELYEKFRMIKDFGRDMDKKHTMNHAFEHVIIGYNFKFTEFQAAVGLAQMKKLPQRIKHKKNMYKLYRENLSNVKGIEFLETDLNNIVPWFNDILLPNQRIREGLINHLTNLGIGSRIFYPPIHSLPPYATTQTFPTSVEISNRGLWLPSSSFLSDADIEIVSDAIKNYINSNN
jgi:perosamine synthetase